MSKNKVQRLKLTKAQLIADLTALTTKHGDVSRDFYRAHGAFGRIAIGYDAYADLFGTWDNFKLEANLVPVKVVESTEPLSASHRVEILREKEITKRENRKQDVQHLLDRIQNLESEVEILTSLQEVTPQIAQIEPDDDEPSESTAVLVCSDWHSEERVDPNKVNGLNEYNLEVFAQRSKRLFQRGARMWYINNKDTTINTMIVPLLGDFISGNIHDDIRENNSVGMTTAILNVAEKICSGLQHLLDETDVQRFIIPCHSGNHGRVTKEQRIATESENSIEYLLYHMIKTKFENEPRLDFIISQGAMSHVLLYDRFAIRFHHGHSINYGGGIGGLYIPVNKKIAQWNKATSIRLPDGRYLPPVALDVFGHYHQYIDGGNFICNGSLIGYNPFAQKIAASPEPPTQAFFLVNKRWNAKTMGTPIFVTE